MGLSDGTKTFEILTVVFFFGLLAAALYMFFTFYICDSQTCKSFEIANEKAPPGTKSNVLTFLSQFFGDGIWPIPYIGSTVLTVFCLWFLSLPINIKTFAIVFSTSFIVIYFLFSFVGHHYMMPSINYVSEYIEDNCPSNTSSSTNFKDEQDEPHDDDGHLEPVSFATPVNIF